MSNPDNPLGKQHGICILDSSSEEATSAGGEQGNLTELIPHRPLLQNSDGDASARGEQGNFYKLTPHCMLLENMEVFEEDIALAFIRKKNIKGLNLYLEEFLKRNPFEGNDNSHPSLQLSIYELALADAAEDNNLSKICEIIEDRILPMKDIPNGLFTPFNFLKRIQDITAARSFDAVFKERKINDLMDYIRLHFRQQFRPQLVADDTILQFSHRRDTDFRPYCMACGQDFPEKNKTWFEYHISRSEVCMKQKISKCDGVTPFIIMKVNEVKKSDVETSSGSAPTPADKSKSSVHEKGSCSSPGRKRKMSDGGPHSLMEKEWPLNELHVDDPADVLGNLLTGTIHLINAAWDLDCQVRQTVYPIFVGLQDGVNKLSFLMYQRPLDSFAVLKEISKLETKTAGLFHSAHVFPPELKKRILDFIRMTCKFRVASAKSICSTTVDTRAKCDQCGELIKISFEINLLLKDSVGSGEVTKLCEAQNEEIANILKLFHQHTADAKAILDVVSSISKINDHFLDKPEILPMNLLSKLLEMYTIISNLLRICILEIGAHEGLHSNGTDATMPEG